MWLVQNMTCPLLLQGFRSYGHGVNRSIWPDACVCVFSIFDSIRTCRVSSTNHSTLTVRSKILTFECQFNCQVSSHDERQERAAAVLAAAGKKLDVGSLERQVILPKSLGSFCGSWIVFIHVFPCSYHETHAIPCVAPKTMQDGPLPVENRVITPLRGVIYRGYNPSCPFIRSFIGG